MFRYFVTIHFVEANRNIAAVWIGNAALGRAVVGSAVQSAMNGGGLSWRSVAASVVGERLVNTGATLFTGFDAAGNVQAYTVSELQQGYSQRWGTFRAYTHQYTTQWVGSAGVLGSVSIGRLNAGRGFGHRSGTGLSQRPAGGAEALASGHKKPRIIAGLDVVAMGGLEPPTPAL